MKKYKKLTPEQLVNEIQDCCKQLGWHISMDESSPGVSGLIIGEFEFVNGIVDQLEEQDNFSIYSSSSTIPTDVH